MPANAETTDAIRNLMERLRDAWGRGDGEAYGSVFADDAQYVTAPGERMYGRRAIADSHQKIFDTFFRGTKLGSGYPTRIRPLTPDVALVEASGSVLFPGEVEEKVSPNGLMTCVVARQDGVWRIVSFQNTPTGRWRTARFFWRYLVSRMRGK